MTQFLSHTINKSFKVIYHQLKGNSEKETFLTQLRWPQKKEKLWFHKRLIGFSKGSFIK